ncbi:MAG: hypoxanthine phosphoribosyltransferase [Oligoflexia bacterium]|nr:hypoxanthine phosphoribosyltransferase [Oligoflexia bacterium]
MIKNKTKLYIKADQINSICTSLGRNITRDYTGKELVVIGILKGGLIFLADLIRNIDLDFKVDFVRLSSYGHSTQTSGKVEIHLDVSLDIKNKHVLVVEDILDTGITLDFFIKHLQSFEPASIEVCTLLDKPSRRRVEVSAKYIGKKIDDHFVVGYGLDYKEVCRNYADIYQVLDPSIL